ncbi:MAG TPA: SDR family oxidoreductase [Hyphomicrobiaceae bacterium]|nr:SDR family oxidoreductase [Hyphomicrobiaceae bacterium]
MGSDMKYAIVTGGSGLIGSEICARLIRDGWRVANFDVRPGSPGATYIAADIGDPDIVDAGFAELGWDRIDLLVNNGGRTPSNSMTLVDATFADWRTVLDSYLTSTFLMSRRASQLMPDGAAIVNIASTRALMSEGGDFMYAAAKGGIVALTQALAIHLGPKVRVNAIAPGWISGKTDLRPADHDQHPVGRVGRPTDIADAVMYLAGAGFVTGQTLVVDGGMTKKMMYVE